MRFTGSLLIFVIALLLIAALTVKVFGYLSAASVEFSTKVALMGALAFNIAALTTLAFFITRNLFKLYQEKKRNVLGYRFKTKLTIIFVMLALIPSMLLFIVASGLSTNFINKIFSPHIGEQMTLSTEMAREFYDFIRGQLLMIAEDAASGKRVVRLPYMYVYTQEPKDDLSDVVKEAFKGRSGTEVISRPEGDLIRAAAPLKRSDRAVVVAEYYLPATLSQKTERLRELNEEHLKMLSYKEPIRLNYIFTLGFVTLMIVFTGLWFSLKISSGITTPIRNLAIATEQVKSGDLSTQVHIKSDDEIGLLIDSFNRMVVQLRENKESLEMSYIESDKRRLYLENILSKIRSGVIFLDYEGRIITINRAASDMLRLKRNMSGLHYNELIESLNSEDLKRMVRGIQGRRYRSFQREVSINIDGIVSTMNVYISDIIETDTSKGIGILVVIEDLTELIKAQKALAWQEVARRIAHEIKNPLTPIKLSAERLMKKWKNRDSDFDAVFEKSARTIINEVDSLRRLVDEFSRFGRMPEMTRVSTNLEELIDNTVSLYRGYKGIDIALSIDQTPVISIDREQFKRAIINIIDNAITAMNQSGELGIALRTENDKVILELSDTGPGIDEGDREKLFMPYFSGRKEGTGLGLAIAGKIIAEHGGRILVRNNQPKGTIFAIEIPLEEI